MLSLVRLIVGLVRDEWFLYSREDQIILISELRRLNKNVEKLLSVQEDSVYKPTGIPYDSKVKPGSHLSHGTLVEIERMERRKALESLK